MACCFYLRDSKDERHRATVRWTVVTASDQTPAGVRIESLHSDQNDKLSVRTACRFFEGLEERNDIPKLTHLILHNGVNDDRINTR